MNTWDRYDWATYALFMVCVGLIIGVPFVGIVPWQTWQVIVFLVLLVAQAGEYVIGKVKS